MNCNSPADPLVGWEGMKFGQLILRRIVKIVATKCPILRLKCTKIDSDPLAGFKGPYF